MKNLKLLVVFAVLIACSQIGLSQTIKDTLIKKIYLVDVKGNAIKFEDSKNKKIDLWFRSDVPELTDQQVSQLLKDRKIERCRHKLKGRYELGILFYVPLVDVDSCFLSGDGWLDDVVSYKPFQSKEQPRMFSWWYLFAVLSVVSMVCFQKSKKKVFVLVFGIAAFVFAAAAAIAFMMFVSITFAALMFLLAFAFVGFSYIAKVGKESKKFISELVYIYYVCMIAAGIFAYLQL